MRELRCMRTPANPVVPLPANHLLRACVRTPTEPTVSLQIYAAACNLCTTCQGQRRRGQSTGSSLRVPRPRHEQQPGMCACQHSRCVQCLASTINARLHQHSRCVQCLASTINARLHQHSMRSDRARAPTSSRRRGSQRRHTTARSRARAPCEGNGTLEGHTRSRCLPRGEP